MKPGREVTHSEPVWRERADFIIATSIAAQGDDAETEQLWARRVDGRSFEICCIPFFVYDLSLGDIVETDDSYVVTKVCKTSGRYVFRVWFGDSFHPRDDITDELASRGALLEWASINLLAVDARDQVHASEIAGFLQAQEDDGRLVYETGRTG